MHAVRSVVASVSTTVSSALDINQATLSGAIDIIVIQHDDGSLSSTPFHVRFGKLHVLHSSEKQVAIEVNDVPVPYTMKLGRAGEAYFVLESQEPIDSGWVTSPLVSGSSGGHDSHGQTSTSVMPPLDLTTSGHSESKNAIPLVVRERRNSAPSSYTTHDSSSASVSTTTTVSSTSTNPDPTNTSVLAGSSAASSLSSSASSERNSMSAAAPSSFFTPSSPPLIASTPSRTTGSASSIAPSSVSSSSLLSPSPSSALVVAATTTATIVAPSPSITSSMASLPVPAISLSTSIAVTSSSSSSSSTATSSSVTSASSSSSSSASSSISVTVPRVLDDTFSPPPTSPRSDDDIGNDSHHSNGNGRAGWMWSWGGLPQRRQKPRRNSQHKNKIGSSSHTTTNTDGVSDDGSTTATQLPSLSTLPTSTTGRPHQRSSSLSDLLPPAHASFEEMKANELVPLVADPIVIPTTATPTKSSNGSSGVTVTTPSHNQRAGFISRMFNALPFRRQANTPTRQHRDVHDGASLDSAGASTSTSSDATKSPIMRPLGDDHKRALSPPPLSTNASILQHQESDEYVPPTSAPIMIPAPRATPASPSTATSSTTGSTNHTRSSTPTSDTGTPSEATIPQHASSNTDNNNNNNSGSSKISNVNGANTLVSSSSSPMSPAFVALSSTPTQPTTSITSSSSSPAMLSPSRSSSSSSVQSSSSSSSMIPSFLLGSSAMSVSTSTMVSTTVTSVSSSSSEPLTLVTSWPMANTNGSGVVELPSFVNPTSCEMSMCGRLLTHDDEANRVAFSRHQVSYEQLSERPSLVFEPDLVFKFGNMLVPSRLALPSLLSHMSFGRPLAIGGQTVSSVTSSSMLTHPDARRSVLPQATEEHRDTSGTLDHKEPTFLKLDARVIINRDGTSEVVNHPSASSSSSRGVNATVTSSPLLTAATSTMLSSSSSASSTTNVTPSWSIRNLFGSRSKNQTPTPIKTDRDGIMTPPRVVHGGKTVPPITSSLMSSGSSSPGSSPEPPDSAYLYPASGNNRGRAYSMESSSGELAFTKALRPPQEMLRSLHLREGRNKIQFSVTSRLQGTQSVSASIYLWRANSKIVISDVDGTITKSDVLGQVMPVLGRDWSHNGVTQLFTAIQRNGYHLLYLTSRAIGQAGITRGFLSGLRQGDSALPEGPVIMSPDRLFASFAREVVFRRPHEFKIAALRDVRHLFPRDHNPFTAGFGNRITDVMSYCAVGVPLSRIFIINPAGQLSGHVSTYMKSYPELSELVHEMFPAPRVPRHAATPVTTQSHSTTNGNGIGDGTHGHNGNGNTHDEPVIPRTNYHSQHLDADYNDYNYWKPAIHTPDQLPALE